MTDHDYRFSIIPAGAITDRRLELRDLQVLCLLGRHTTKGGWCRRSQTKMARELDCSRASIQRSLERLYEAGWVQKELRTTGNVAPDPKHPHASHAYRVIFDHDVPDSPGDQDEDGGEDQDEGVPNIVGPPPEEVPIHERAPGCPHIQGHQEGSFLEPSEREARAKGKEHKKRDALKALWPTGAIDDQAKIDREWDVLPDIERDPALELAPVFLAEAKKNGRKYVPPLWKYIEQRNWKHLKAPPKGADGEAKVVPPSGHAPDSPAGRALLTLARVARYRPFQLPNKNIVFMGDVTPQLLALANAPPDDQWVQHKRGSGHFAAWRDWIRAVFTRAALPELTQLHAPWPWPPRKDGSIIQPGTDPPGTLSEQDIQALSGT